MSTRAYPARVRGTVESAKESYNWAVNTIITPKMPHYRHSRATIDCKEIFDELFSDEIIDKLKQIGEKQYNAHLKSGYVTIGYNWYNKKWEVNVINVNDDKYFTKIANLLKIAENCFDYNNTAL